MEEKPIINKLVDSLNKLLFSLSLKKLINKLKIFGNNFYNFKLYGLITLISLNLTSS